MLDFPVTVSAIVLSIFGGLISSFRTLDSVASGKPLSSSSSNSCRMEQGEERNTGR